jgi:hypothetical protein
MIKLKRLFKQLTEQATEPTTSDIEILSDPAKAKTVQDNATKVADALGKVKDAMKEGDLDEAELVNHMYDYKGGVEYILRDPSQAQEVAESIMRWTERKGFTIISKDISKSGKIGYFHFRIGVDPERDAQRIQGYFSSKIEIAKYRFHVRQSKRRMRQQAPQPEI